MKKLTWRNTTPLMIQKFIELDPIFGDEPFFSLLNYLRDNVTNREDLSKKILIKAAPNQNLQEIMDVILDRFSCSGGYGLGYYFIDKPPAVLIKYFSKSREDVLKSCPPDVINMAKALDLEVNLSQWLDL